MNTPWRGIRKSITAPTVSMGELVVDAKVLSLSEMMSPFGRQEIHHACAEAQFALGAHEGDEHP